LVVGIVGTGVVQVKQYNKKKISTNKFSKCQKKARIHSKIKIRILFLRDADEV